MAGLNEQNKWENEIYRIEENDPVHGGEDGITNKPTKQLANRTKYLKAEVEKRYIAQNASIEQKGLAQLYTGYDSQREDLALTPKTAYLLKALIDSNSRSLNDRIPNSKKSDSTDSNSSDTVATSKSVKEVKDIAESKQSPADTLAGYGIANFKIEQSTGNANDYKTDGNYYFTNGQNLPDNSAWHIEVVSGGQADAVRQIARKANDTKIKTRFFNGSNWSPWKDTGGDSVPLGAVVAFPRDIANPQGFLLADGSTFSQQTYPDLYRSLGNKNTLPNLKRSDVGMLAYFPTDNIPDGWLPCNHSSGSAHGIERDKYPELYDYLVPKYGTFRSGSKTYAYLPHSEDRFIRSAHGSLAVGQKQTGSLIAADSIDGGTPFSPYVKTIGASYAETANKVGLDIINANDMSSYDAGLGWAQGEHVDKNRNETLSPAAQNPNSTGHLVGVARPKSIAFKLCIKAKNSFDEVRFWVKAFGEVTNVGALDASRLAQDIQNIKASTERHDTQFQQYDAKLQQLEGLKKNSKAKVIWRGNLTAGMESRITLSESMLNKHLILFLQVSSSHTLTDTQRVCTASVFVDENLINTGPSGKYRGISTGVYDGSSWRTIELECLGDTSLRLRASGGMYLKQISAI